MKKKKLKIDDIANLAGVSKSTVSRVLANSESVKPETRSAVLKVIEEMGYSTNSVQLHIAHNTPPRRTVAVIVPSIENPFWVTFIAQTQQSLFRDGYTLSLYETQFNPALEKECLSQIKSENVHGVIAVSSLNTADAEDVYGSLTCTVTLLDRVLEGTDCNSVIQDNFHAGYLAAKHLIELGHSQIAFIAGPIESQSIANRLAGYRAALESSFITSDESLVEYGEMSIDRGIETAQRLLRRENQDVKAFIIANDETAIGFIDACRTSGISIPEDIAVVSFDDTRFAALKSFDLTSVRQPVREMSQAAVEIILDEKKEEAQRRIMLQPEIIVRGSTVRAHKTGNEPI